ncbi:MAG: ankyrin repeat domain-containing protein [Fibrobacteres bacterium]|nr:ankyrin repeat domain-containing protein [Fibrobacterota bacterium]
MKCTVAFLLLCQIAFGNPLWNALESNRPDQAKALLQSGYHVDSSEADGSTALLLASAATADSATLEFLLANGADPNLADSASETPLMRAAQSGDLAKIRTLLRWKANVDMVDREGASAVSRALSMRKTKAAALLVQAGAKFGFDGPNARRFLSYILESDEETLALLLPAIKDLDIKIYDGQAKDSARYERILVWSARRGWTRAVSLALSRGADPNLRDRDSLTPLELAFKNDHHEAFGLLVVRQPALDSALAREYLQWYVKQDDESNSLSFLVKKGGRVDVRTNQGLTPLMVAAQKGMALNMRVLLKSKADLSLRDIQGRSALHHAIESKCGECVDLLLDNGASAKVQDRNRLTPVTQAILASDTSLARRLIAKGGRCIDARALHAFVADMKTDFGTAQFVLNRCKGLDLGQTLLQAAAHGNMDLARELISRKANVNARDETGRTPLMLNGYGDNRQAIRELLEENGAKLNARDNEGNTAESYYEAFRGGD